MTLIGRKYVPHDNSYCKCLTTPGKDERLAGTFFNDEVKLCEITSQPYMSDVSFCGINKTLQFINVKYGNDEYKVLFSGSNVDADVVARERQRIKRKNDFYEYGF